jgi:uncharacterized membrane protein (UPF0127 family)
MKIINKSNDTILAENVILANTPFKRMKGLLGKKEFSKGQALILRPCNSIHTFFMYFPIDILFVNRNNKVVKAVSSLKPFRLSGIYLNSAFAIELPSGIILSTKTQENDTLLLE